MATTASTALERDLKTLLGEDAVLPGNTRTYLTDATESRNLRGRADAVVLPNNAEAVQKAVAWCYDHDVAIIPRGGGTGFTGGAVPLDGGVVVSLENLKRIRHLDPGMWRAAAEAGMVTADLRRRARENGLLYPPDPGSHEQSQLGGNIATNAGGPHAFKYGVTGAWITGLEFVLAPGELVRVGGPIRKDVAGYDLKSLMIGSEGTLGIVTAAWVKLIPAPEAALPLAAFYPDTATGCAAIEAAFASGVVPAAIEYLDEGAIEATRGAFRSRHPRRREVHGDRGRRRDQNRGGLHPQRAGRGAERRRDPDPRAHRHQRDQRAVALARRRLDRRHRPARRQGLGGHRRPGRLPRTSDRRHDRNRAPARPAGVLLGPRRRRQPPLDVHDRPRRSGRARAGRAAAEDLFALAVELGGSVSGEHGIGVVKNGQVERQWAPAAVAMHEAIKRTFDPKGLLNPGKKLARA